MSKLLITGGLGFIGSEFVRQLSNSKNYSHLYVLDAITYAANIDSLIQVPNNSSITLVKGNICDANLVNNLVDEVDMIVNFAAESHVDKSIESVAPFITTNVLGTVNLLEAAKKSKVSRFLQVSTDEVYGSVLKGESTELAHINPQNPYSASKAAAENFCMAFANTFGVEILITRSCNNYGPFQQSEKFIPNSISSLLKGEKIKIYGDGLQEREWIHVSDNCRAISSVLELGKPNNIYNIGSGIRKKNIEIAEMLLNVSGREGDGIEFVQDRPGHDRRYAINSRKVQEEFGWAPKIEFYSGMKQTYLWYQEREARPT